MNVVHTIADLRTNSGGPARTVPRLCEAIAERGCSVELIAHDSAASDPPLVPNPVQVKTSLLPARRAAWSRISSAAFRGRIEESCRRRHASLIHDHGVWLPTNHAAAAAARKLGLPLVVSPRGMLEPWAWRHKAWKKSIGWRLYQRRDLESAAALCCTSEMEARNLRALGVRQPIAVIPNGVELPHSATRERRNNSERIALFLSRLHPKKGLFDLVAAWSISRPAGWRAIIAGPDEGGHRQDVEAAIFKVGLERAFSFAGPVADREKSLLYRQADLFVLPTRSENFGVVVAEAMAHGLPVITTKAAPWDCLERTGGGWWIDCGAKPLAEAIRTATALSDAERAAMGARGRATVEVQFAWPRIAEQMLDFYGWIAGSARQPDCIAA